jgi:L-rhamnose-H+ transport protein
MAMHLILGITVAVSAGVVNGLFAVPMKLARRWSWENVWLPFSILGLVLFPRLLALTNIPHLENAYAHVDFATLLVPVVWGVVIYSGSLMFGRSMVYIGTALAFALLVGSMSIVGVLAPIIVYSPEALRDAGGKWIIAGMGFLFAALIGCARAGALRAGAEPSPVDTRRNSRSSALLGMGMAILGGILSGLLSLGLNTGWAHTIGDAALRFGGASESAAPNATLVLVLLGGAIPNCLYCVYLLSKNGTWKAYRRTGPYWLIVVLMALMYSGSTVLWGMSTSVTMLGRLGPSVGWALFIGAIAVSSNIGGFLTGEWKNAGTLASRMMVSGVLAMVVAMVLVGYGNFLLNV